MTMIPIPKHLDDPPRLILWPIDEALSFLAPFILLAIAAGYLLLGFITGLALLLCLRHLKQGRGHAHLMALLYWHLPQRINRTRFAPPSYIREVLG